MPWVTNEDGGTTYQQDPAPEGMMWQRSGEDGEQLDLVPDPNANKPALDPNSLAGKAAAYKGGFDLTGGWGMERGQLGDIYSANNPMTRGTNFLNDGRMYAGGEDAPTFIETSVITDGGYRVPLQFAKDNGLNILGIAPPDVEHNGSSFDQFMENVVGPAMEIGIPIAVAAGAGGLFGSGTGIPGFLGAGEAAGTAGAIDAGTTAGAAAGTTAGTTAGTATGGLNYAGIGKGALKGALSSALTGGDPLTGALTGGLSSGLSPIISSALKDIVPSSLIPTLTSAGTQLITTGGIDPTRLATNALFNTIGGGVDKTIDKAILPFFTADAGDDSVQVASGYGGTTDSYVGELLPGDEGYQYPVGDTAEGAFDEPSFTDTFDVPISTVEGSFDEPSFEPSFADANTAQDIEMLGDDPLQVYKDLKLLAEDATDLSALNRPIAYLPGGGSINASDLDAYNANTTNTPNVTKSLGTFKTTASALKKASDSALKEAESGQFGDPSKRAYLTPGLASTGKADKVNSLFQGFVDQLQKRGYATGGMVDHPVEQVSGPDDLMYAKHYARGFAVGGPGTGQSDDIPTMLSDGEYVIDADTVSALGDGSSKAGAEVLDKFRQNIRKHKRSASLSDIPPKAKNPLSYLKSKKEKS